MISQETLVEIHVLHRQGRGIRAIARILGVSRNTVRNYLRQPAKTPTYPERQPKPSILDPFKIFVATLGSLKQNNETTGLMGLQRHWIISKGFPKRSCLIMQSVS